MILLQHVKASTVKMTLTPAKMHDLHRQYLGSKHGSMGATDSNHLSSLTDHFMPYFNKCAEGDSSSQPDFGLDQLVTLQSSRRFLPKLESHKTLSRT